MWFINGNLFSTDGFLVNKIFVEKKNICNIFMWQKIKQESSPSLFLSFTSTPWFIASLTPYTLLSNPTSKLSRNIPDNCPFLAAWNKPVFPIQRYKKQV